MIPIAKIDLQGGALDRGHFGSPDDLRNLTTYANNDIAQVYSNKRVYRYDSVAGTTGDDDGDTIIRPSTVSDGNGTGRWVATNTIQLTGANSVPGTNSATITNYDWRLLFHPAIYTSGSSFSLVPLGAEATITIPGPSEWVPGGIRVFLIVSDSDGNVSISNPFNPELNPQSVYDYLLKTPNYGFSIPPAGARNWHVHYQEAFTEVDSAVAQVAAQAALNASSSIDDKRLSPLGSVTTDNTPIPGVSISNTPLNGSYVRVFVNGLAIPVGNGTTSAPCYFSNDGGATAKSYSSISVGDSLCWNPSIAGFPIDVSDVIELDYLVSV